MAATILSNFLVVTASIGMVALLIFLLPVPRLARTGMCALTVLGGLAWGSDQVRLAFPTDPPPLSMMRLAAGAPL